jgi:translation initiation factor IF-2
MQQRQLRLGDIVDDYCPRERRLTNHAVVAMVGDDVKQTRCTTCDADHEYKHAKVPPQRRKKEEGGVLYQQVLAGMPRKAPGIPVAPDDDASDLLPAPSVSPEPEPEPDADPGDGVEAGTGSPDESVHRPLIRATLPRLTDEPPQRREPEFTMRTPQHARPGKFGRGGFRGGRPGPGSGQSFGPSGGANGHRADGQRRQGQGPGQRSGNSQGGGRAGQSPGNRHGRPGGGHGQGHGPGRGGKKSPR